MRAVDDCLSSGRFHKDINFMPTDPISRMAADAKEVFAHFDTRVSEIIERLARIEEAITGAG